MKVDGKENGENGGEFGGQPAAPWSPWGAWGNHLQACTLHGIHEQLFTVLGWGRSSFLLSSSGRSMLHGHSWAVGNILGKKCCYPIGLTLGWDSELMKGNEGRVPHPLVLYLHKYIAMFLVYITRKPVSITIERKYVCQIAHKREWFTDALLYFIF